MVFKPSFECLKKKINFIQEILKLETLLYQNIFISFYRILYLYLDSNKKKWSDRKKNMPVGKSIKNFEKTYLK